jgi:hypothetical protein
MSFRTRFEYFLLLLFWLSPFFSFFSSRLFYHLLYLLLLVVYTLRRTHLFMYSFMWSGGNPESRHPYLRSHSDGIKKIFRRMVFYAPLGIGFDMNFGFVCV